MPAGVQEEERGAAGIPNKYAGTTTLLLGHVEVDPLARGSGVLQGLRSEEGAEREGLGMDRIVSH